MIKWFRNLKKWQKGALIGLIIGIIFGLIISPLRRWIPLGNDLYIILVVVHISLLFFTEWFHTGSIAPMDWVNFIMSIAVTVFYCGMGAAIGGILQINTRLTRRISLALLIILLLLFYMVNVFVFFSYAMSF
jgi:hypothetical protein